MQNLYNSDLCLLVCFLLLLPYPIPAQALQDDDQPESTEKIVVSDPVVENIIVSDPAFKKNVVSETAYVPTPPIVVDLMLELAKVKSTDLLYDLGCGDGRIVVTAAEKYGCTAEGYDIVPDRIRESNANVQRAGVEDLVTIKQEDIFKLDLSEVDVVTLYLFRHMNYKLIPQLEKMKPGSRVVAHEFEIPELDPDFVVTIANSEKITVTGQGDPDFQEKEGEYEIYLYTIPFREKHELPSEEALAFSKESNQSEDPTAEQHLLAKFFAQVYRNTPLMFGSVALVLAATIYLVRRYLGIKIQISVDRASKRDDNVTAG